MLHSTEYFENQPDIRCFNLANTYRNYIFHSERLENSVRMGPFEKNHVEDGVPQQQIAVSMYIRSVNRDSTLPVKHGFPQAPFAF